MSILFSSSFTLRPGIPTFQLRLRFYLQCQLTGPLCPRLLHAVIAPRWADCGGPARGRTYCKRKPADEGGGRRAGARRQIRFYFAADPAIGPAADARRSARPQA